MFLCRFTKQTALWKITWPACLHFSPVAKRNAHLVSMAISVPWCANVDRALSVTTWPDGVHVRLGTREKGRLTYWTDIKGFVSHQWGQAQWSASTLTFVRMKETFVNSLLSGSFLIKFSSLSAPTKIEELTAGSDEKTQRSPAGNRTQGLANSCRTL